MPSPASYLNRQLSTYQLYGANTNVGKTIFSTLLCKASSRRTERTWYLKPVSTGPLDDADDAHVRRFAPNTKTKCLFQFKEPISPHLAAAITKNSSPPPSDALILDRITGHAKSCAQAGHGILFVETAGGVHSPTPVGTSQADLYRPLRLPVILVADARLGGISSTISAFESLHVRGYDLECVLVFQDEQYKNHDYLAKYFAERGIATMALPPPAEKRELVAEDEQQMDEYYERVAERGDVEELLSSFQNRHLARIERLESMAARAHQQIWYPFTQHKSLTPASIMTIDSAHGDFFQTLPPPPVSSVDLTTTASRDVMLQPTFDASASWWTQGLGHGSPALSLSAAYAAGRYGHVMFAGAIHEPALLLAELLLKNMKNPRLQKVFFSDNGSTGMEVAIKMALTAASKRYGWEGDTTELGVIGLKGSYHGDTIGAMDLSEMSTFNAKVHWYQGRGYWFDFPQVKMKDGVWVVESPAGMEEIFGSTETFGSLGQIFNQGRDESVRRALYEKYITDTLLKLVKERGMKFGALVLEPIILGAGGMLFCDPLFQRTLVNVVRSSQHIFEPSSTALKSTTSSPSWSGLPVIFDEVFTGLYRLGHFSPSTLLNTFPDISVHAKLLTGGLLPLCTTLASDSIYEAFLSDEKSEALLHGHSYTAHAVGCAVAQTSIQTMLDIDARGEWDEYKQGWVENATLTDAVPTNSHPLIWSIWSPSFISALSHHATVDSVIALGSVLAIRMRDRDGVEGYTSLAAAGLQRKLLEGEEGETFNVHSRVLGNVLYLMGSQTSERRTITGIETLLSKILDSRSD